MKESIASKKLWFTVGVVAVGFAYAVIAAIWLHEMQSMFETFCGLLEFCTGAYVLGNVGNKWVLGRATVAPKKAKPPEPEEPSDPLDRDIPTK